MDLRTRHVKVEDGQPLTQMLRRALGEQFDVVLESDHLHVEWDPKETPKHPEDV